jgi:uncharacterized protein (TIGR02231 family)
MSKGDAFNPAPGRRVTRAARPPQSHRQFAGLAKRNGAVEILTRDGFMRSIFPAAASVLTFLIVAPNLSAPALAGEIEAASKIDSVTVYPDAAIVSRIAEVDLPQGDSVLVFKNLPLALDPASLRLEGEGAAKMTIGAVGTQVAPSETKAPDNAIEAKLANLRAEREAWQSTIDALSAKKAMIIRFSQSGPEKLSPEAKPLDVAQWSAAWDAVAVGLAKLGDDLRPALAKARQLDEQIKALEAERQRPVAGQGAQRNATATIAADSPTQARIKLSYRIGGVGWRPAYDAFLETAAGASALSLTRRANLAQRTGEDWSDVALTVSTARVARASDIPDVEPLKIDFWQAPVAISEGAATKAAPSPAAPGAAANLRVDQGWAGAQLAGVARAVPPGVAPLPQLAEESASQLEAGAYSAEFKIPGRISLAGDGAQKSFVLARLAVQPTLLAKAAPGLDPTAYLQAHFVDAEDAPLLPGEVALHRDGAFVGESRIGFVAPGDGLDLGFGADDKIKIQRAPVNRKENEPTWYNQSKIETREFKTVVKNLHDSPVKVQVIDQVPVSENTAITVEVLPATTPPTEKQVADKRGVMSWTLDLAPSEAKDIRLAYRLRWPADRDVIVGAAPIGGGGP